MDGNRRTGLYLDVLRFHGSIRVKKIVQRFYLKKKLNIKLAASRFWRQTDGKRGRQTRVGREREAGGRMERGWARRWRDEREREVGGQGGGQIERGVGGQREREMGKEAGR